MNDHIPPPHGVDEHGVDGHGDDRHGNDSHGSGSYSDVLAAAVATIWPLGPFVVRGPISRPAAARLQSAATARHRRHRRDNPWLG